MSRAPIYEQLEAKPKKREQQYANEGFVVVEGARVEKNVVAEATDREKEFGHHRANERASGSQPQSGENVRRGSRQHDLHDGAKAFRAKRVRDFEMLARHRASAVRCMEDDREDCCEYDGGKPRPASIAEPKREQRQRDHHRHGVEKIDIET